MLMTPAIPPDERVLGDDELVERAQTKDREAFGELIRRHQRAALRVAAVVSGSTEEASDIVQDAMIKVYGNLSTYRGHGTVRSWMLRIVANEAKNHVRGKVRRLGRDDRHAGLQVRVAEGADVDAIAATERSDLAAALGRLGSTDREVLGCRFIAELSEAETAEVLELAVGTVKSRTSRALSRLRFELEAT
jgi:RNA polymerase sigma factor (sigma-70 family)